MDQVFSFLLWPKREAHGPWKQGRKKRGSITCCTDRANEANKMFIIWLCWSFRFWKGDRELEVRTATYGPGIDQSQHAKSVSHIINYNTNIKCTFDTCDCTWRTWLYCIQYMHHLLKLDYKSINNSTHLSYNYRCMHAFPLRANERQRRTVLTKDVQKN